METKKQFKWFTIFEYEKEEKYLRDMHRAGWRFTKVTGLGIYHFEKCAAQDVVYQLDYNQEGLEHKDEYLKMFDDCGWEHIQDYAGYSYFRKAVTENGKEEGIFCDADSKLQMMQRVLKGRLLPLLIIFLAVLVPQFVMNLLNFRNYFVATMIGVILIIYISVFIGCYVKYEQHKNNTKK